MARRTINLPDSVEMIAREAAESGESFSATVSRLIVQAARGRARLVVDEARFAASTAKPR